MYARREPLSFRLFTITRVTNTYYYERKKIVARASGKAVIYYKEERGLFHPRGGGNTATTPGKHVQNRGRAEFYAPPLKANGNKQQWGLSWWPVTGLISFCQSRVDSRGLQHHDKQTGTQIAGLVSITPRSSSFDSPTDLLLCPRHFHFSPPLGNSYDLRKIV